MHTQFLTITLASLLWLTTTTATPEGSKSGVLVTWYMYTYTSADCSGPILQTLETTPENCRVLAGTQPFTHKSIKIESEDNRALNFRFYPGDNCTKTDEDMIELVGSGETKCFEVSDLNPASFYAYPNETAHL